MGCEDGRCKTSTPQGIFIVTPSLEGSPTKAKEATSPHEVRLDPLDTNPVLQCLGVKSLQRAHLCIYLAAGLEPGTLGFWAQVVNH